VKKVKKKDLKQISDYLMAGAVMAILLAGVGYIGFDIWLASTQWLLVALVLALFGVYFKLS